VVHYSRGIHSYATVNTKTKTLQIRGEEDGQGRLLPCVKGTTLVIGPTFSKPLNTVVAESFCDMKLPVNVRAYSERAEAVYCTYSGQNNNAKIIYGWPVEIIK
jgi:hypothetical protein